MKKVKGNAIAHGESGHTHRVQVVVMERDDGVKIFEGSTEVTHEEHGAITLPNKKWNADQVLETDHIEKMERKVVD